MLRRVILIQLFLKNSERGNENKFRRSKSINLLQILLMPKVIYRDRYNQFFKMRFEFDRIFLYKNYILIIYQISSIT